MKLLLDIEFATVRKLLELPDGSDYQVKVLCTQKLWYDTTTKQEVQGDWEEVRETEDSYEPEESTTDQAVPIVEVNSGSATDEL